MSYFKMDFRIFIFLGIIFLCIGSGVAQDPEIAETILPEIKRVGLPGTLRCVVINQQEYPVYWIHKNRGMTISIDDKIVLDTSLNIQENGQPKYLVKVSTEGDNKVVYDLLLPRLERMDAGNYTCQVTIRGSSGTRNPSRDGQLIVLSPPSIRHAPMTHTIVAREGSNATLICEAVGYPTPNISWVRSNGGLLPNGKLRHMGSRFTITDISWSDRGVFRCLADNAVVPPAVFDTTMLVEFKPVSKAVQSSYGQAENRMFDLTIECTVMGNPEPDLQWYQVSKNGQDLLPIHDDDKHTVNILLNHANQLGMQERWFQLVIRTITANDYGTYICEGRNKYGSGRAEVRLFATSECQGPYCPEEQRPEKNAATSQHVTTQRHVTAGLVSLMLVNMTSQHVTVQRHVTAALVSLMLVNMMHLVNT